MPTCFVDLVHAWVKLGTNCEGLGIGPQNELKLFGSIRMKKGDIFGFEIGVKFDPQN